MPVLCCDFASEDRLIIYATTKRSDGAKRPLSKFLDHLGEALLRSEVSPQRNLPTQSVDSPVEIDLPERIAFQASQLSLFERCPRRFLYTHILHIGGKRIETAYMHMHEVVRETMDALLSRQIGSDDRSISASIRERWERRGLNDHGHAETYLQWAADMVRFLIDTRASETPGEPLELTLELEGGRVTVLPQDVLSSAGGQKRLRLVHTGHARATAGKDIADAAFVLAARQNYPDAAVELVYLADETVKPIPLSDGDLKRRREKLENVLKDVRAGRFGIDASSRTCPNCPAFFVCGSVPSGKLLKKSPTTVSG